MNHMRTSLIVARISKDLRLSRFAHLQWRQSLMLIALRLRQTTIPSFDAAYCCTDFTIPSQMAWLLRQTHYRFDWNWDALTPWDAPCSIRLPMVAPHWQHGMLTFPGQKRDTRHEWLPSIDLPAQFWTLGWVLRPTFQLDVFWCVHAFEAITASEPALRQMLANRGVTCPKASRKARIVWQHWYSKILTVALSICRLSFVDKNWRMFYTTCLSVSIIFYHVLYHFMMFYIIYILLYLLYTVTFDATNVWLCARKVRRVVLRSCRFSLHRSRARTLWLPKRWRKPRQRWWKTTHGPTQGSNFKDL